MSLLVLAPVANLGNVSDFAEKIEELSKKFKFSTTSWFRSEYRNEIVNGVKNSQHLTGLAIDVILDDDRDKEAFISAVRELGYFAKDYDNHIHIGWRNGASRINHIDRNNGSGRGNEAVVNEASVPNGTTEDATPAGWCKAEGGRSGEEVQR